MISRTSQSWPDGVAIELGRWQKIVGLESGSCTLDLCASETGKPEIFWQNGILGGRGLRRELPWLSASERREWIRRIESWQAENDTLRASGDCRYQAASRAAAMLKSINRNLLINRNLITEKVQQSAHLLNNATTEAQHANQ
jgi:hypothetical protein